MYGANTDDVDVEISAGRSGPGNRHSGGQTAGSTGSTEVGVEPSEGCRSLVEVRPIFSQEGV